MNIITVIAFAVILGVCTALGVPTAGALFLGLLLFLAYGLAQKHPLPVLLRWCASGLKTSKNVLLTMVCIGVLTALWRAAGTIPYLICAAVRFINPSIFILLVFLLNCAMSFLIGTSFGTAGTMGVTCAAVAQAMGAPIFWVGGAMLAGCFFGDRCSPVSTSLMLAASVTGTDSYDNLRPLMLRSIPPFAVSCVIYLLAGLSQAGSTAQTPDLTAVFSSDFTLSPICLIPSLLVLIFAVIRVPVRRALLISSASAAVIALAVQHAEPLTLLRQCVTGYRASGAECAALVNGGGITSMFKIIGIIAVASCYSGLFKGTHIMDFLQRVIGGIAARFTDFTAVLFTAVIASAIGCNQAFSVMLTSQLCETLVPDGKRRVLMLEDTCIVVTALVPWTVACAGHLALAGAPVSSALAACYLYLLPLYQLGLSFLEKKKAAGKAST